MAKRQTKRSRTRRQAGTVMAYWKGGDTLKGDPGRAKSRRPMPTHNAKIIQDLMDQNKVKGDFRNWVIIAGRRLVDWLGSHAIIGDDVDDSKLEGMKLVHKSLLHHFVGAEWAGKFWDRKHKRRRMFGEHPRRPVRNAR